MPSSAEPPDPVIPRLPSRLALCAALLAVAASPVAAQRSPKATYSSATSRGEAARDRVQTAASAAERDQALRVARAAVASYEAVVRRFPTSGYCDNALWEGAAIATDAWKRFGEDGDRDTAVRLLKFLQREYPASPFVPRVPAALSRLQPPPAAKVAIRPRPSRPAPTTRATAPGPAVAPVAPATTEVADDYVAPPSRPADGPPPAPVPASARLRTIRREVLPGAVRVTLELDTEVAYRDALTAGRVQIDLKTTRADTAAPATPLRFTDGVVRQVRVSPIGADTRVTLDTAGTPTYSVFTLYNPFRLVVDIDQMPAPTAQTARAPVVSGAAATPPTPVPVAAPAPPAPATTTPPVSPASNRGGGYSLSRQLGLTVSRIVLDPGHGGHDPGARVRSLDEAALVLDVALRLEKLLLKQAGTEVVLTRRTDVFIPLQERTTIANRAGADLFLSIHANASPNPRARGIETYFLNFAPNPEAEAVAARENAASGQAMHALPDIVKAIALNNKIDESRDFASLVQDTLVRKLRGTRNLGVKQAPFVVLIGATMPSILAEISFITNRDDGQLLKTGAHRQKIAEALLNGILRYQRSLKAAAATDEQ